MSAGIPTFYNGRQYRSRLEARWAAFFDALKLKHEYEPFDCSGWIPDFLLRGDLLLEIKPVTTFPEKVARKIQSAYGRDREQDYGVAILGVAPVRDDVGRMQVGWYANPAENPKDQQWLWTPAYLGWGDDLTRPQKVCAIFAPDGCLPQAVVCVGGGDAFDESMDEMLGRYLPVAERAWVEAGNLVQWKAPE